MPRLRNSATGSVVNVSDVTAAQLGAEWVPIKAAPKPKRQASKK